MTTFDYLLMWLFIITFAAVGDALWMRWIRPWLAVRRGWPEPEPDEVIPIWAWIGALVVTGLFFIVVPWVGYAAGY